MTILFRSLLLLALVSGVSSRAEAQAISIGIGPYIGAATPTGDWGENASADTGWGYGGTLSFQVLPFLGLYAGWDRYRFGYDDGQGGDVDITIADSGLRAGAEIGVPLRLPVSPFVMGGGYYGDTEFELTEGDTQTRFRGGDDFGYELAGGLDIAVGSLIVRPLVGYRTRDAELPNFSAGGQPENTTISYYYFTIGATFLP